MIDGRNAGVTFVVGVGAARKAEPSENPVDALRRAGVDP
jgi:hypothetical protein